MHRDGQPVLAYLACLACLAGPAGLASPGPSSPPDLASMAAPRGGRGKAPSRQLSGHAWNRGRGQRSGPRKGRRGNGHVAFHAATMMVTFLNSSRESRRAWPGGTPRGGSKGPSQGPFPSSLEYLPQNHPALFAPQSNRPKPAMSIQKLQANDRQLHGFPTGFGVLRRGMNRALRMRKTGSTKTDERMSHGPYSGSLGGSDVFLKPSSEALIGGPCAFPNLRSQL